MKIRSIEAMLRCDRTRSSRMGDVGSRKGSTQPTVSASDGTVGWVEFFTRPNFDRARLPLAAKLERRMLALETASRGYAGTYFWVDPKEQVTAVFMSQAPSPIWAYYRKLVKQLVYQAIVD